MKNVENRILGVIVVYDQLRSPFAVACFKDILSKSFENYSLRIVTNNPATAGDISGSNDCGEFSGWADAVSEKDYEDYDICIFANDTFCTKRPFDKDMANNFVNKILLASSESSDFLIGELNWHINYKLLLKREKCILQWVRTSIFALSTNALRKVGGVSLTKEEISGMVETDCNSNFVLSEKNPVVYRKRIEDWLRPEIESEGWSGAQTASKSTLFLKAKCVLQELNLTQRCLKADVNIYPLHKMRNRDLLLKYLYKIQN